MQKFIEISHKYKQFAVTVFQVGYSLLKIALKLIIKHQEMDSIMSYEPLLLPGQCQLSSDMAAT